MYRQAENHYAKRRAAYRAYMRSKEWKEIRLSVIVRDGGKCTRCGSKDNLCVHHKNYATFGCEDLDDLETLCENCHVVSHGGRPPRKKKTKQHKKGVATAHAYKAAIKEAKRLAKISALAQIKNLDKIMMAELRRRAKARKD